MSDLKTYAKAVVDALGANGEWGTLKQAICDLGDALERDAAKPGPPAPTAGPAFPVQDRIYANGEREYGSNGMSLREYFAGQWLAGLAACPDTIGDTETIARGCWAMADALIAARERKERP